MMSWRNFSKDLGKSFLNGKNWKCKGFEVGRSGYIGTWFVVEVEGRVWWEMRFRGGWS